MKIKELIDLLAKLEPEADIFYDKKGKLLEPLIVRIEIMNSVYPSDRYSILYYISK